MYCNLQTDNIGCNCSVSQAHGTCAPADALFPLSPSEGGVVVVVCGLVKPGAGRLSRPCRAVLLPRVRGGRWPRCRGEARIGMATCIAPFCANAEAARTVIAGPCARPPPACCSRLSALRRACELEHGDIDGVPLCACGNGGSNTTRTTHRSSSGAGGEPCACFSVCSAVEAFDLLRRLPVVTSRTSRWHAYLSAVYGGDVALPFDVQHLRLLYKDTAEWRRRRPAPSVALPLASCSGRPRPPEWAHSTITARSWGITRSQSQPACAPAECSQWLLEQPRAPPVDVPTARELVVTHRVHYVELRALLRSSAPVRRAAAADHEWLEVMRQDYSIDSFEGVDGYGCWFFALRGSGYFVSVGRTWPLADGTRMASRHANSSELMRAFVAAGHRPAAIPTPRGEHRELLPFVAHQLGYESLQVLARETETAALDGPSELVVTTDPCVHAPRPLRACAPPELDVRTGPSRQTRCACDEQSSVLNCRGNAAGGGGGARRVIGRKRSTWAARA